MTNLIVEESQWYNTAHVVVCIRRYESRYFGAVGFIAFSETVESSFVLSGRE